MSGGVSWIGTEGWSFFSMNIPAWLYSPHRFSKGEVDSEKHRQVAVYQGDTVVQ